MISILCRSRGRPELARKMYDSANQTAEGKIEILFYLDEDDVTKHDYPPNTLTIIGNENTVNALNLLALESKGDVLLLLGDDTTFKTSGWDTRITDSIPEDEIALFSFDDGRGGGHPHPAITRKWYETLGYVAWPEFNHWYVDSWLVDMAIRLDRLIDFKDILILHEKVMDETALRIREKKKGWNKKDREIYQSRESIRVSHTEKLKKVIDDFHRSHTL